MQQARKILKRSTWVEVWHLTVLRHGFPQKMRQDAMTIARYDSSHSSSLQVLLPFLIGAILEQGWPEPWSLISTVWPLNKTMMRYHLDHLMITKSEPQIKMTSVYQANDFSSQVLILINESHIYRWTHWGTHIFHVNACACRHHRPTCKRPSGTW